MQEQAALILDGSTGLSFFLREMLLEQGSVEQVYRCSTFEQATAFVARMDFKLIVIDLVDAWVSGVKFGLWLQMKQCAIPVILIVPHLVNNVFTDERFWVLVQPFSLDEFMACAQTALATTVACTTARPVMA